MTTMQEQLRALVHRHHANIAVQIATVERLLTSTNEGGFVSSAQVVEAQELAHQMKGTAGSMGFPTVGAAAAALDANLRLARTLADPISPSQLQGATDLLAELKRIAGETTPEMSVLYNLDLSQQAR